MSATVFFSWQSDRPSREGRNLIEKALETAVARIAGDMKVEEAVREGLRVDKDTKDVPGSPPIFQTILRKIDNASVFVADLTMCGTCCDDGLTPNPNVLIEYGWALKSLGYSQVLTVMNAAYGEPSRESMPFDLASFRFPITYNLPDGATSSARNIEREQLANSLERALRGIFESEEFKATLPKAPTRPPFPRKAPKNGRARFRPPNDPLGFVRDPVAQLIGSPQANPVYLAEGPATWLRLMPSYDPGRKWLTQELKQSELGLLTLGMAPLMQSRGNIGFLQADDGCGYRTIYDDTNTVYSVSYVFDTAEVWIINAWVARMPGYLQLDEDSFIKTLDACASFLDRLGCAQPYQWAVGMEGVIGRNLIIPNDRYNRTIGPCLSDLIEDEGVYRKGDNIPELLRPFFEKVFDQCGVRRPSRA
jgi:hypothetical protein